MTTTDSIWAAAEHLLRRDAEELRESSTSSRDRDDWTGEEEAKADYDEHIAAADALASLSTVAAQPPAGWREALEFYAQGRHFGLSDESAWDTVSGEPQNFWCDEAGTATIEDGTVAAMALLGTPLTDEETAPKAAPAAVAGPLNELEELDLLNKLIHLGARAASAHAKSNSDDGHAGTAAYVEWSELRADMGELIRKAYAASAPAAQGDAEDAARLDWLLGEGRSMAIDSCDGEYRVVDAKWSLVVTDWMPTPRAAIDAARSQGRECVRAEHLN